MAAISASPGPGAGERSVRRDGHGGQAEADREKLFASFLQLDNSRTSKVGGTGLGLAITRKIVELMQRRLRVQATPGQGSTFVVVVQVRQQAVTSESHESIPDPRCLRCAIA
jgi:signal transduction histidine kinase